MAGGYKTGSAELQTAAQNMMNTNDQLQGKLNSLLSQLEPLQTAWVGEAATAFHSLLERYSNDAKNLNQSLVQIAEQVKGSAVTYTQQEQEQQQAMSSLMGRLNG
ncbi:MAG: WXG100 family type VII secretion target [Candidatus Dormibacteraceae bacterium]